MLVLLLAATALPAAAAKSYCCVDESGRQTCGDQLPPQCYGRAYRELSERGTTLRQVEAPLSSGQRELREAQEKRSRDEERLAKEEKRKNQALLDTYSSEKDIDFMRERMLTDVDNARKHAEERYQEAVKRKQRLDGAAKVQPLPQELANEIKRNELELSAQQAEMEAKLTEMDAIRAKFAAEKKRYLELTQGKSGK